MNHDAVPPPRSPSLAIAGQDLKILDLLSIRRYRYLTCSQLATILHKPSTQICARMEELGRARMVRELHVPVTTSRHQSETIYTLARLGGLILAERHGVDANKLYARGGNSYLFLTHAMAITDFRLSLEQALSSRGLNLNFWTSEWQLRRMHVTVHFEGSGRKRRALPFVPDALFGITTPHGTRYFFLEMDRGTAGASDVARKILAYVEFFRSGRHRTLFRLPYFRVLIVTTTNARMNGLLTFTRDMGRCQNMFLFLAIGRRRHGALEISPERMLGDIWRKCGDSHLHSIVQ